VVENPTSIPDASRTPSPVSRPDRERLLGQRGLVAWLTGLSGSGKTALARGAERVLSSRGRLVRRLDGDDLRAGLNSDLGFSMEDRRENIRRIAEVAGVLADTGVVVLVSAISPTVEIRDLARSIVGASDFVEIFVNCPLEVCEARDIKGLYKRARGGEIPHFTGVGSPYEPPVRAILEIRTDLLGEEEAVRTLSDDLLARSALAEGRR
jgi:adenylylsulfate kinase